MRAPRSRAAPRRGVARTGRRDGRTGSPPESRSPRAAPRAERARAERLTTRDMTPWSRDCTVPVIRVAALYDIHGNLPALEAALAELEPEQPDLIVCGGDVVPGPMPIQTIVRVRGL